MTPLTSLNDKVIRATILRSTRGTPSSRQPQERLIRRCDRLMERVLSISWTTSTYGGRIATALSHESLLKSLRGPSISAALQRRVEQNTSENLSARLLEARS